MDRRCPPLPPSPPATSASTPVHAAGATVLEFAIAEEVDPAVVRRVPRAAGIAPGPLRKTSADRAVDRLADPAWLRAQYATKGAKEIAEELGCPRDRVYEALHAAGIPMRENGFYPKPSEQLTPELADRIVSLYLAGWTAECVAGDLGLAAKDINRLVEERAVKRTRTEVASLAHAERLRSEARPCDEWTPEVQAEVLERDSAAQSG